MERKSQGKTKLKLRDNQPDKQLLLSLFIETSFKLRNAEHELGIRIGGMTVLLYVIKEYIKHGKPVSQYSITGFVDGQNKTQRCYQHCVILRDRGLLERVGTGNRETPLWIPTVKPMEVLLKYFNIEELQSIVSTYYQVTAA